MPLQSKLTSFSTNSGRPVAAAYLRMSTESQNYSLHHQEQALKQYADVNQIDIVKMYIDAGKSGLNAKGRPGLLELLDDVKNGDVACDLLLVYDISRWGRFQDVDESAYYEYVCRQGGLNVVYCAELFSNDGSPIASILKSIKRLMAAEYSRELSAKVFAAQCNLVTLGFRPGGSAGYGLRRVLLNSAGEPRQVLEYGQKKALTSDRVALVLGPPDEVAIVQQIYKWYVQDRFGHGRIALMLNYCGVRDERGKPWTKDVIRNLLTSEKYVGNLVFNRTSYKLKNVSVSNPESMWVRKNNAFPALISDDVFTAAKAERQRRSKRYTDAELLEGLRQIQIVHGRVSGLLIYAATHLPAAETYRYRFGSLTAAYRQAGITNEQVANAARAKRRIQELRMALYIDVMRFAREAGATSDGRNGRNEVLINNSLVVRLYVARGRPYKSGRCRWVVPCEIAVDTDFVVVAQMLPANTDLMRYYLFSSRSIGDHDLLLREEEPDAFAGNAFTTLRSVFGLVDERA